MLEGKRFYEGMMDVMKSQQTNGSSFDLRFFFFHTRVFLSFLFPFFVGFIVCVKVYRHILLLTDY